MTLLALVAGAWWTSRLPQFAAAEPHAAGQSAAVRNSTLRVEGAGTGSSTEAGEQLQAAQSIKQSDTNSSGLPDSSDGGWLQRTVDRSDFIDNTNNPQKL